MGGTGSLLSHACVKRNAVFGARFKCLPLYFSASRRESDTYQNGLGHISDTYPNPYPPVMVLLDHKLLPAVFLLFGINFPVR